MLLPENVGVGYYFGEQSAQSRPITGAISIPVLMLAVIRGRVRGWPGKVEGWLKEVMGADLQPVMKERQH